MKIVEGKSKKFVEEKQETKPVTIHRCQIKRRIKNKIQFRNKRTERARKKKEKHNEIV